MKLSCMSHVAYPVKPEYLAYSGFSRGRKQRSMECLAFTNTMGKGNPGDRVDMDVSPITIALTSTHIQGLLL